jgi:hypothetical protein
MVPPHPAKGGTRRLTPPSAGWTSGESIILPMVEEKRAGFKKKTISLDALLGLQPQPDSKFETPKKFDIGSMEGDNNHSRTNEKG